MTRSDLPLLELCLVLEYLSLRPRKFYLCRGAVVQGHDVITARPGNDLSDLPQVDYPFRAEPQEYGRFELDLELVEVDVVRDKIAYEL